MSEPQALTDPQPEPGTLAPDPRKDTVAALSSPVLSRPTTWTTAGGILGNVAGGVTGLVAVFSTNPQAQVTLGIIAGCLLIGGNTLIAIGNTLARNTGVAAAAAVSDRSDALHAEGQDGRR